MKKKLFKSALVAVVGVGLMAGSTMALPWDDFDNAHEYKANTNMNFWTTTDFTSNVTRTALFQLEVEDAGYESGFGLFYVDETLNSVEKFQVFDKVDEPISKKTLTFRYNAGQFQITDNYIISEPENSSWIDFSSVFGFYYDVFTNKNANDPTYSFYTLSSLNTQDVGIEHITTAYNPNEKETYIYLEDLLAKNADWDWTDMTVSVNGIQPIPEPTTMLLFGSGLLGLVAIARRRRNEEA